MKTGRCHSGGFLTTRLMIRLEMGLFSAPQHRGLRAKLTHFCFLCLTYTDDDVTFCILSIATQLVMLTQHFNNSDVLTVTACGGGLEHGEGKQKVTRAKLCNRILHFTDLREIRLS